MKTVNWPKIITDLIGSGTQGDLAKRVGVRQSSISDWKRGLYEPSGGYAVRLVKLHQSLAVRKKA